MLEIKDLRVNYGRDGILNGLNLKLEHGETLAIIGESGAGKTTLGLSIMRLIEGRVCGSILFEGKDILTLANNDMQELRWNRVAMVFQNVNNSLNPVINITQQVAEPIIEHGLLDKAEAVKKAEHLLERFGMSPERFKSFPHQLSGGEQQRVMLAMALSNDPELLILDEPLSSLDVISREEIGNHLLSLGGNCTKLIITHDLDTASRLSDKLAVLYGGRIVETGQAQDVLNHPRHPYTRALIRSYPNMTSAKDLQGIKGSLSRNVGGCPFHPRCTQAIDICSQKLPEFTDDGKRGVACHRGGIITLLAVENLSKSYGKLKAVNDVNLRIEAGETLALVGQSGCGKTTLANSIMGLRRADSGKVSLEGKELQKYGQDFYKRVQMVFQNPGESLSHRLTALEAVIEPLNIHSIGTLEERKRKAVKTIGEVELPQTEDFLNKYPHHMSGGEMQRVAIARALVLDPELIIADEPTAFLDASVGAKILKLLLRLQEQRGLSMLYITHDIAIARKVSDRMAVMFAGGIVEEGLVSRIIAEPQHPYTRQLIKAASSLS